MTANDPIADMLMGIHSANTAKHDMVDVSASRMKVAIVNILANEGRIERYEFVGNKGPQDIRITLKYGATKNNRILSGLKRVSKPDLRIYAGKEDMLKVLDGLGTATVSTNQGIITDKETRRLGAGGEALAFIW